MLWSSQVGDSPGSGNDAVINDDLRAEIEEVRLKVLEELPRCFSKLSSGKNIGRRLIYLFQRDLLPGISVQVLEKKDERDSLVNDLVDWKVM